VSPAVSWGLLSTARINGAVINAARASDLADVVAVASRDEDRARQYAEQFGIPRAHGSYDALLADPEIEAIYVSLPNRLHVEWTIRALEAGKHVLCEKPMDRRPAEVARAFDVAEREGLVLSEAFMWRHHPQTRRVEDLLHEGTIGDVRLVRASFSFPLATDAPDVRLDAALDGGGLLDVGLQPADEPLVQLGPTQLGQPGVRGVAKQHVGEGERLVPGNISGDSPDQHLAGQGQQGAAYLRTGNGEQLPDSTDVEDLPHD